MQLDARRCDFDTRVIRPNNVGTTALSDTVAWQCQGSLRLRCM